MPCRQIIIPLCALFAGIAITGCTMKPVVTAWVVSDKVEKQVLQDLTGELTNHFPPAKTRLSLSADDHRLGQPLRTVGYAVQQPGNHNLATFSIHYMRDSAMYLGVLRVGQNYTLSRLYIFEAGELQVKSTSLSDEASPHSKAMAEGTDDG